MSADSTPRKLPSVDVVVPCYNYGRFLSACLAGILNQKNLTARVLIIDDASTDDSPAIAQQMAASDPRISFRRHEKNHGHIQTYNEGLLGWATADYVVLISADDVIAPGALERAVAALDANPDASMLFGKAQIFTEDAQLPDPAARSADLANGEFQVIPSTTFLQRCSQGNPVPTPTAIVRTRFQHQVGGYDPALPHSGDMEMWMRLAACGPVITMNAVQAFYRVHGRNMSTQYYSKIVGDYREQLRAFESATRLYGNQYPKLGEWLASMRLRISDELFWAGSHFFDDGNVEATAECLRAAKEIHPAIATTRSWKLLELKRRIGPGAWGTIRPILRRLRGLAPTAKGTGAGSPTWSAGQQIGWWPKPV